MLIQVEHATYSLDPKRQILEKSAKYQHDEKRISITLKGLKSKKCSILVLEIFFLVLGHKYCVLVGRCVSESAASSFLICYIVFRDPQLLCQCCSAYHLCSQLATPQTSWADFLCCGWWQEVEDDPENKEEKVIKRKTPYWEANKMIGCMQLLINNWS